MSLISFISNTISAGIHVVKNIGESISNLVENVGEKISVTAKKIIPLIEKVTTNIGGSIATIGRVVGIIARVLDVIYQGEKIADIGDRAIQGEQQGITPEKYDNNPEAYLNALRRLKLDEEKSNKISLNDKLLAGSVAVERVIKKKVPKLSTANIWPLIAAIPGYFNDDRRLRYYIDKSLKNNYSFSDFLKSVF
jgi:hypothetical protein